MQPSRPIVALLAAALCALSHAQSRDGEFEWSVLGGEWAESADHAYGCRKDNLHFRFTVAPDRKRLSFKLDRQWPIAGQQVTEYSARIVKASGRSLIIRYGDELKKIPNEMREWELLFIGPGTYRWRSTTWPVGQFNTVIGVKCGPS